MQTQLVSAHGMLAILEVLEAKSSSRDVTCKLLQIINLVSLKTSFLMVLLTLGVLFSLLTRMSVFWRAFA